MENSSIGKKWKLNVPESGLIFSSRMEAGRRLFIIPSH